VEASNNCRTTFGNKKDRDPGGTGADSQKEKATDIYYRKHRIAEDSRPTSTRERANGTGKKTGNETPHRNQLTQRAPRHAQAQKSTGVVHSGLFGLAVNVTHARRKWGKLKEYLFGCGSTGSQGGMGDKRAKGTTPPYI